MVVREPEMRKSLISLAGLFLLIMPVPAQAIFWPFQATHRYRSHRQANPKVDCAKINEIVRSLRARSPKDKDLNLALDRLDAPQRDAVSKCQEEAQP